MKPAELNSWSYAVIAFAVIAAGPSDAAHAGEPPSSRPAAEFLTLKPRFAFGRTRYVEATLERESRIRGSAAGAAEENGETRWKLGVLERAAVAEGDVRLAMTIERLAHYRRPPRRSEVIRCDTDQPEDDSASLLARRCFDLLIGGELWAAVAPAGTLRAAGGWPLLTGHVDKNQPGNIVWKEMRASLTDDLTRDLLLTPRYDLLPPRPVRIGDSWTRVVRRRDSAIGAIDWIYRCTLDSVDARGPHRLALWTFECDGATVPGGAAVPGHTTAPGGTATARGSGMEFKSGRGTGRAMFDLDTGEVVRFASELKIVSVAAPPPASQAAGSQLGESDPRQIRSAGPRVETTVQQSLTVLDGAARGLRQRDEDGSE